MLAEIITIGDEILIGQIINTNSSWLSNHLNNIGIKVKRITSIGDNLKEILDILIEAQKRSKIVIITGGLGPTSDDITKPALCEYFNTTLVFDESVYDNILRFLDKRGGAMNELNRNQALVPKTAKVIQNEIGTAPGLWMIKDGVVFIALPGVPFEMENMMKSHILQYLQEQFKLSFSYHKSVLTTGISESKLALDIKNWEDQLPEDLKLAYLPSPGVVKIRLSAYGESSVIKRVEEEIIKLQAILRDAIYGYDDDSLEAVVGKILNENHKTLSTAESCTGGNIARLITSIPGSSAYFLGSIISYSNEIKHKLLDVPEKLIKQHGAVSREVAESMAEGAVKKFNSDYSIAVTGIAGPTGGSLNKPVGTTWIAICSGKQIISEKFIFGDNRERNIIRASFAALNKLRKLLISK
jgi:nicotinamide-nucleotide amidase